MRKVTTIILLLGLFWTESITAQHNSSAKYEGRPMPDWVMGATPEPHNNSYYYKVFDAASADREEARNMAIKKAFQQAISFIDATVESADVFAAVERGGNLNVVSETYHIPIYFTCEYAKKTPDGTQWVYWILCQIAVRGYGNNLAQFDLHFSDCNTHTIWDKEIKKNKKKKQNSNARALAASMFVPGLGQMLKKQGGKGAAFLLSELVVFGGGAACYYLGQDQMKTVKSMNASYDQYKAAKNKKNLYDIAMYGAFGIGAAIHITNMVNAWYVKDKNLKMNITFAPAILPTNDLLQPSFAYGAGVQIKF